MRTTAVKQEATTLLLQNSVASGNFTTVRIADLDHLETFCVVCLQEAPSVGKPLRCVVYATQTQGKATGTMSMTLETEVRTQQYSRG